MPAPVRLRLWLGECGKDEAHLLGVKTLQQGLQRRPQIDEDPDKAARLRQVHRLLQRRQCRAGLPLRRKPHSTQRQDLDLKANAAGAHGNRMQSSQDAKRRLYIGRRAPGQEDVGLRQVRVLQKFNSRFGTGAV